LKASGQRPIVDRVFAFEDVAAAFTRLHDGPFGKVLVKVS
jgi:NADPH:quinone reductase-like Zn-dependent oxidoreductase